GRDRGIVDQRMQFAMVEPLLDLLDRGQRLVGVGEVDLDVILRPHFPRAVLRERMARACDHAPAGGREAFDREMADAAARPRQEQSAARLVIVQGWHWASFAAPVLAPGPEDPCPGCGAARSALFCAERC